MKLQCAVIALIAVVATCSASKAQSTGDILRRLEALEQSDSDLKKENAALRDEIRRMKSATQATPAARPVSPATKPPVDAFAAAPSAPVYKAMPVSVPAARSWTGFYLGAHGGFAQAHTTGNQLTIDEQGGFGGVQMGLNYQLLDHWVLGFEQDASFGNINGSASLPPAGNTGTISFKFDAMATFRERVGFTWDRVMFYETAGLALAQAKSSISVTAPFTEFVQDNRLLTGLAVGGGVEFAATPNLLVKAEYLYLDFPTKNFFAIPALAGTPMDQSGSADVHMHTARVGANWLFN
ncbi:MAG: outer membrane beta-barrel protein [Xanthobacteraceae bacterium]|jgi:outer membrane immunogenic protein